MVESRKVLTVSYGTFSCTLEGYDSSMEDSVGMMKQIATYFRDLAAEDRQFGVTAPQATEALARHTEREIARRIKARMGTSDLVLSLGRSLDRSDAPLAGSMPFPTTEEVDASGTAITPGTATAVTPSEDFGAKLQRIRAVMRQGAAPTVAGAEALALARDVQPAEPSLAEVISATEPLSTLPAITAEAPAGLPPAEPPARAEAELRPAELSGLLPEKRTEPLAATQVKLLPDELADILSDPVAETPPEPIPEEPAQTQPEPVAEAPFELLPDELADILSDPVAETPPEPIREEPMVTPLELVAVAPLELRPELLAEVLSETFTETPAEPLDEPVAVAPLELRPELLAEVLSEQVSDSRVELLSEKSAEGFAEPVADTEAEPLPQGLAETFAEPAGKEPLRLLSEQLAEVLSETIAETPAGPLSEAAEKADHAALTEALPSLLPEQLANVLSAPVTETPTETLSEDPVQAPRGPFGQEPAETLADELAETLPEAIPETPAAPKPKRLGKRLRQFFGRFRGEQDPVEAAPEMAQTWADTPAIGAAYLPQPGPGEAPQRTGDTPFLLTNAVGIQVDDAGADLAGRLVESGGEVAQRISAKPPGQDIAADLAEADDSGRAAVEADLADLADFEDAGIGDDLAAYPDYADLDQGEIEGAMLPPAETLPPDEIAELVAELAAIENDPDDMTEGATTPTPVAHAIGDSAVHDDVGGPVMAQAEVETSTAAGEASSQENQEILDREAEGHDVPASTTADRAPAERAADRIEDAAVPEHPVKAETAPEDRNTDAISQEQPIGDEAPSEPAVSIRMLTMIEETAPDDASGAVVEEAITLADVQIPVASMDMVSETVAEDLAEAAPEISALPVPEAERLSASPTEETARARFRRPEDDADALDRLLSQTDAQMSGPEAARRREAIAHLRAAVAASEAAHGLGQAKAEKQRAEDSFRADFHQVVQPRRPTGVHLVQRGERPRPSPLRLVASQRIDAAAHAARATPVAATQPIRPRRITIDRSAPRDAAASAFEDTFSGTPDTDGFPDFAAQMGATSLSDLIEAAAAHATYVEGIEDFSRPQILTKVAAITAEATQEEGLRAFGILLREGRILRSPRAGRFEVARDTRFHPERRAV